MGFHNVDTAKTQGRSASRPNPGLIDGIPLGFSDRKPREASSIWPSENLEEVPPLSPGLPAPRATPGIRSQKIINPNGVAPDQTGASHHAMA